MSQYSKEHSRLPATSRAHRLYARVASRRPRDRDDHRRSYTDTARAVCRCSVFRFRHRPVCPTAPVMMNCKCSWLLLPHTRPQATSFPHPEGRRRTLRKPSVICGLCGILLSAGPVHGIPPRRSVGEFRPSPQSHSLVSAGQSLVASYQLLAPTSQLLRVCRHAGSLCCEPQAPPTPPTHPHRFICS